jgi:hypothetical protein
MKNKNVTRKRRTIRKNGKVYELTYSTMRHTVIKKNKSIVAT